MQKIFYTVRQINDDGDGLPGDFWDYRENQWRANGGICPEKEYLTAGFPVQMFNLNKEDDVIASHAFRKFYHPNLAVSFCEDTTISLYKNIMHYDDNGEFKTIEMTAVSTKVIKKLRKGTNAHTFRNDFKFKLPLLYATGLFLQEKYGKNDDKAKEARNLLLDWRATCHKYAFKEGVIPSAIVEKQSQVISRLQEMCTAIYRGWGDTPVKYLDLAKTALRLSPYPTSFPLFSKVIMSIPDVLGGPPKTTKVQVWDVMVYAMNYGGELAPQYHVSYMLRDTVTGAITGPIPEASLS